MHIDKKLLQKSKYLVYKTRNYSISHLQRKLFIGYNQARDIMEIITNKRNSGCRLFSKKKKRFCYIF